MKDKDPRAIAKLQLEITILKTRRELCRLRERKIAMRETEVRQQLIGRKRPTGR